MTASAAMSDALRVLVADDEPTVRHSLARLLTSRGHSVETAGDGGEACRLLVAEHFDCVLTDLKMPGADGMEVLRTARERRPDTSVIIMTAYGSVDAAVEAMRLGALQFLEKPVSSEDLGALLDSVRRGGEPPAAAALDAPEREAEESADDAAAGGEFGALRNMLMAAEVARGEPGLEAPSPLIRRDDDVPPGGRAAPAGSAPGIAPAPPVGAATAPKAKAKARLRPKPEPRAPDSTKDLPASPRSPATSDLPARYGMVGADPAMDEVFDLVERVAASEATVLIIGESGTGKELVARAIHDSSDRRDGLLVPVNCAAIPEGLLESELFGHVKGAFTGAHRNRTGRFALANGGTLFLDEIGEMSLPLQAKLLRVLQERVVEPVGAAEPVAVDVRVLAATHRDLEEMVEEGTFREDLFYRLSVIPVALPSLRQRRSDVPVLLEHFLGVFAARSNRPPPTLCEASLPVLARYDWPGNVRELENLAERLVVLVRGDEVSEADIPAKFRQPRGLDLGDAWGGGGPSLPEEGVDLKELLGRLEMALIDQALERTKGNRNQAARLLSLNRTTLVEKLRKRGL